MKILSLQEPQDYMMARQTIVLTSQRTALCGSIAIEDDNILENNEIFFVTLRSSDMSAQVQTMPLVVTIVDNDSELCVHFNLYNLQFKFVPITGVTVSFNQNPYNVEEGMTLNVCVSLSEPSQRRVIVAVTTSRDTSSNSASGNSLIQPYTVLITLYKHTHTHRNV